jgi:hypothetical protein
VDPQGGPAPPRCSPERSGTAFPLHRARTHPPPEDPDNANPSKWHAIAKHVPNRTNKDCRKRWFAKMANDVVKGGWSPQEDEKLVKGIERYGTRSVLSCNLGRPSQFLLRWSLVASVVQTRNSDRERLHQLLLTMADCPSTECAKRWTDTLNPAIDRTTWTPEAVGFPLLPAFCF